MALAYIGLGSNLADPVAQLTQAFTELEQIPSTYLLQPSSLYRSAPVGPQDQPPFINAVALLSTELEPLELLDALQAIEQAHQRVRIQHWGPRTLDLDLLLYDQRQIEHPRLIVPHPYMTQRGFVLVPLEEIAPLLALPSGETVTELLAALPEQDRIDCQRIGLDD